MSLDGRALRQHWDAACDGAADVLRRHIPLTDERGDADVAGYLRSALGRLGRLVRLRNAVDGRRARPGRTTPGLVHDAPVALGFPPYTEAGDALAAVTTLFTTGLGADGWDWSRGFPPGWPTSLADRLRVLSSTRTA